VITAFDTAHDRTGPSRDSAGPLRSAIVHPAPVTIRPITASDLPRILEINEANVPEVGSVDAARLEFIVAESPIALTVEADRRVVGFCLVLGSDSAYDSVNYRWFGDRYDDFMYLDRVAFDAASRGHGLGTALYAEVDRLMIERGDSHLALEVNVDPPNEGSLRFHARLGFVEVGQQDTPYGIRVSMQMRPVTTSRLSTPPPPNSEPSSR
jgi:predicted GNAT superfamily acetyltransferase